MLHRTQALENAQQGGYPPKLCAFDSVLKGNAQYLKHSAGYVPPIVLFFSRGDKTRRMDRQVWPGTVRWPRHDVTMVAGIVTRGCGQFPPLSKT